MAQRTKTDTVTPPSHETTPPTGEERALPMPEPANDNDQIVFWSWDRALVPPCV